MGFVPKRITSRWRCYAANEQTKKNPVGTLYTQRTQTSLTCVLARSRRNVSSLVKVFVRCCRRPWAMASARGCGYGVCSSCVRAINRWNQEYSMCLGAASRRHTWWSRRWCVTNSIGPTPWAGFALHTLTHLGLKRISSQGYRNGAGGAFRSLCSDPQRGHVGHNTSTPLVLRVGRRLDVGREWLY